ncbi:SEC-C domain-containing protein [soil metagenome]
MKKEIFTHNEGVTQSEKYLFELCKKTFLSLWSYPGLFKEPAKELCDLLVIFENNILIFSDKDCEFPNSGNLEIDWQRWSRRAIYDSVKQAWGAESWIKKYPNRIFTDSKATIKLPFSLPDSASTNFHLIVVAHNGSRKCAEHYGGSGSLMFRSNLKSFGKDALPFQVGDIDKSKTFVHVLDDTTLEILLSKLDTISDFVSYLEKKEKFLRSSVIVLYAGEEELLAHYFKFLNEKKEHDFLFPEKYNLINIEEGFWEDFLSSKEARNEIEANKISYMWDRLIEKFNYHALTGTQYEVTEPRLQSSEIITRIMARESRIGRRALSKYLKDLLMNSPADKLTIKNVISPHSGSNDTVYVLLLFPIDKNTQDFEYRERRKAALLFYCRIAKYRNQNIKNILGIATESGKVDNRTEDAIYIGEDNWTPELQKETEELFLKYNFNKDLKGSLINEKEFPE